MSRSVHAVLLSYALTMGVAQVSLSEQSTATKTLNVQGTSVVIPEACEVTLAEENAAECILEVNGGGIWSFGAFSATVPSFSSLMADMVPEMADPTADIDMVLKGLVEASSEGMTGMGARLDKFRHRRVAKMPGGAEGCEMVWKEERFLTARNQEALVKKLELLCAARSGPDDILETATIVSFAFVPSIGETVPDDFEAHALGWLGSVTLSP